LSNGNGNGEGKSDGGVPFGVWLGLFAIFVLAGILFAAALTAFIKNGHEDTRSVVVGDKTVFSITHDRSYESDWLIPVATLAFTLPIAVGCLFLVWKFAVPKSRVEPADSIIEKEAATWVKSAQLLSKGVENIVMTPFGARADLVRRIADSGDKSAGWKKKLIGDVTGLTQKPAIDANLKTGLEQAKQAIEAAGAEDLEAIQAAVANVCALASNDGETKDALQKVSSVGKQWERWSLARRNLSTASRSFEEAQGAEETA
jgi:hypothetical protein